MQFWLKTTAALAVSSVLAGCSVFHSPANDDKNYTATGGIKQPQSQTTIKTDPFYAVPSTNSPAKDQVEVYSPAQILNSAEGSWVEEGEAEVRIFFERPAVVDDLANFMWQALEDYLAKNQVATRNSVKPSTLESDWFVRQREEGIWFWKGMAELGKERYQFTLEMKPHGRQASMKVRMLESEQPLNPILKRELEIRTLNDYVAQYDWQLRKSKLAQATERPKTLSLGQDKAGNAALLSTEPYPVVWSDLTDWLQTLKIDVTDLNQSLGRYDLKYHFEKPSAWDRFWDDEDAAPIDLASGEYVLKVVDLEPGTSMTLYDANNQPVSGPALEQIFAKIQKLLTKRVDLY